MPLLIALLAPLLWGSTYAVVSLYLTDYSPYWVAVWRALPAGVLLLLLHPRRPPLVWSRQFLLAFCNITAFFALLFVAAYRLPGAVAGTLGATLPLILMGLAWLQDGVRPTIKWLLLGVMGLVGVLLLLNPSANLDPVGVACALLATLLIGQSSRWMQRWPVDDLLALTAWQLLLDYQEGLADLAEIAATDLPSLATAMDGAETAATTAMAAAEVAQRRADARDAAIALRQARLANARAAIASRLPSAVRGDSY